MHRRRPGVAARSLTNPECHRGVSGAENSVLSPRESVKKTRTSEPVTDSGRWSTLLDELLRGMAHALSNRIAALMAHSDGVSGGAGSDPSAVLSSEITKLLEINRLLRLLPAGLSGRSEGLLLEDVLSDAVALLAVHPRGSGGEFEWTLTSTNVQPVRAERWVLLRICLLLLDGARGSGEDQSGVDICVDGGEQEVSVRIRRRSSAGGTTLTMMPALDSELAPLLARAGATLTVDHDAGRITFAIPSLAELRRRDRIGDGSSRGAARGGL